MVQNRPKLFLNMSVQNHRPYIDFIHCQLEMQIKVMEILRRIREKYEFAKQPFHTGI